MPLYAFIFKKVHTICTQFAHNLHTIYKKDNKWRCQVRIKNKSSSKIFDFKREAIEWGLKKEQQFKNPSNLILNKTFGQALEKYRNEISPLKKGYKTEKNRLNKFLVFQI